MRKIIAALLLFGIWHALIAAWAAISGIPSDYAANIFLAGLVALAASLCFHVFAIRRILAVDRALSCLLGVAIFGVLTIIIFDLSLTIAGYVTLAIRRRSDINWGDSGIHSGLPALGTGFDIARFVSHLPDCIPFTLLTAVVWFPLLTLLESWAYGIPSSASRDESNPNVSHP